MELVRTACWWVGWSIGRQADCGGGSGALPMDELAVAGRCDHLSPTLSLPTTPTAVSQQQQHESLALRDDAGSAAARRRGERRDTGGGARQGCRCRFCLLQFRCTSVPSHPLTRDWQGGCFGDSPLPLGREGDSAEARSDAVGRRSGDGGRFYHGRGKEISWKHLIDLGPRVGGQFSLGWAGLACWTGEVGAVGGENGAGKARAGRPRLPI